MKYSVDINITVDVPESEVDAIDQTEDYDLSQYLEERLEVSYDHGDAWVCFVEPPVMIAS